MRTQSGMAQPEFSDCSIGDGTASITADCATLAVPFDPADPAGARQELFIARLAARTAASRPDPVVLLAGGPGQAASEAFPALIQAFRHLQRDRDLILVDQRGTGRSGRLDCPRSDVTTLVDMEPAKVRELSAECHAGLEEDTTRFTTSVAVQDLDSVRTRLGIKQWNLYGVSYGTRVALHYLRRFPARVRSMILDAPVPPDVALGPDIALHAQQALDNILARCADSEDCHAAFPRVATDLDELLVTLENRPKSVTFEDVSTGRQRTLSLTRDHLAATLRLMSYSAYGAAILPSMLHEAVAQDNYTPLARQALLQIDSLENTLATGLNSAVVCTEDAPWFEQAQAHEPPQRTYLGDGLIATMQAGCEAWPRGLMDDDFRQPLTSDKPVLVLSGTADPITPPAYGERVLENLRAGRHLINDGQGHMQAPLGCIPTLMAQFVELGNTEELNIDCLSRIRPPAFFVDANGPRP